MSFMSFVTGVCAIIAGIMLLIVALFGTVTAPYLPDSAAIIVCALCGIGAIAHGVLR